MPTILKTKNSVTTTVVPTTLQQGELAVNITDKKLWVGNAATTPVQLLGGGADGTFTNISVSGVASFADGTVSLPSITNIGDTNTGIFFPAADTIAFTEGGVESMRIASGNVGIGTTNTSSSKFSVVGGTGTETLGYFACSDADITGMSFRLNPSASTAMISSEWNTGGTELSFGTGGTERGRFTLGGDFCVGTTTSLSSAVRISRDDAAVKLLITGDQGTGTADSMVITYGGGAALANYRIKLGMSGYNGIINIRNGSNVDAVQIHASGDSYLNGGNVGIGTSSPGVKLEVVGSASESQSANSYVRASTATNASYDQKVQYLLTTRAANSAYAFLECISGNFADAEFLLRGDGNGYADGTWNNNGADYAEYFESATGQAISVGSTVVLENNKVRLATESDNPADVIGVVRPKEPSKASMVVGNTAWNKWANKYLTDDFDRFIMEDHNVLEWVDETGKQYSYESNNIPKDVVVPNNAVVKTHDDKGNKFQHYKLNPSWDKDAKYINRENRDEWLIIGLIGQVKILKGQVMCNRWNKMRDVSANVEEWFIR